MPIRLRHQRNPLKPGHVSLKVEPMGRATSDDFADWMEAATSLTRADVRGVLTGLQQFLVARLAEGQVVDFDELGIWSVSVPGAWPEGEAKAIRPTRGETPVRVHMRPKTLFHREVTSRARFDDAGALVRRPLLSWARRPSTGEEFVWKAGDVLHLHGRDLKFDPTDSDQGVFLLPEGAPTRRIDLFVTQTAGNVMFQVPSDLTGSGDLRVELRIKYRRTKTSPPGPLRTARLGRGVREVG
jgi:HU domain fused to wHTH, Ig, or Glycine-rich motif/Domain of unknown function (DUF4469) with IG-like fold